MLIFVIWLSQIHPVCFTFSGGLSAQSMADALSSLVPDNTVSSAVSVSVMWKWQQLIVNKKKCYFMWICAEEAAFWLLSAQMLFSLVLISTVQFLLSSSPLRSTTVRSQSCETIRPIKRCLPAIKIICSPRWERKWGEWKEKSTTFWDRSLIVFTPFWH